MRNMMAVSKYRLIDHTADFGIHVTGENPGTLFVNAAYALYDLITDIGILEGKEKEKITVTGADWPDLMVNWLREILFFWNGREALVKKTAIVSISENKLSAMIFYDPYNPDQHAIKLEIKAVTYHQLQVVSGPRGWEGRIIFDI